MEGQGEGERWKGILTREHVQRCQSVREHTEDRSKSSITGVQSGGW